MKLFHKGREEINSPRRAPVGEAAKADAAVKVLGSGCAKCRALEEAVRAALAELGMDASVDHVTNFAEIAACGVMTTPALVVDGKVVSCGRVLKKEEAKSLLQACRQPARENA